MTDTPNLTLLSLSPSDLTSVDEYRKRKNTAVLTIMFTDIEGFTALTERKGETYVHALHEEHDRILVEAIEEDSAGVVIKFIGDSIMAVFAEPATAVERALLIQRRLAEFNAAHPDIDDIKVRIGLHMGQTAVENKMQTDLFGRHVNRASRVESLAAGGHIYLTYPVFDSAKSWLMDDDRVASRLHGAYYLKGIEKAEEIYEVYNRGLVEPAAPRGARRKGAIPTLALAGAAFLAVAVLVLAIFLARGVSADAETANADSTVSGAVADAAAPADAGAPADVATSGDAVASAETPKAPTTKQATPAPTEVFLLGMVAREPILDLVTPLAVTVEDEAQGLKKSVNDISPGRHVLHYIVSPIVRYYAEFEVKPGKNVVKIAFRQSYLPSLDIYYAHGDSPNPATSHAENSYFLYDRKTLARVDFDGKIDASVSSTQGDDGLTRFDIEYAVTLNGKEVARDRLTVTSETASQERVYQKELVLVDSLDHRYVLKTSTWGPSVQLSVGAEFEE